MKKAKIMLMAIAVLAIVGGSLAFKAGQIAKYGQCNLTLGVCNLNTTAGFTTLAPTTTIPFAPIAKLCTTTATIPGQLGECTSFVRVDP